jgi:hypothetical protein
MLDRFVVRSNLTCFFSALIVAATSYGVQAQVEPAQAPDNGAPRYTGSGTTVAADVGFSSKQWLVDAAEALYFEDFSDGLAEDWEITDGNEDGVTWEAVRLGGRVGFGMLPGVEDCSVDATFEYLTGPPIAIDNTGPLQVTVALEALGAFFFLLILSSA